MTANPLEALRGRLDVSRETLDRLELYAALLRKWTPKINLVAPSTLDDLWERHLVDSAQLVPHISAQTGHLCDLGSGGGLPGIVIGCFKPDLSITMIESDQRKATFLRTAARDLGLTVAVRSERIEKAAPAAAQVVSARALAPLPRLLPWVDRHLTEGGTALLLKGRNVKEELSAAQSDWDFEVEEKPSITSEDSSLLVMRNLRRV